MDVARTCDVTLPIDNPEFNVDDDQIYLGILATTTWSECVDVQALQQIKMACHEFMVELVKQIRSRFDLKDSAYKLLEFILPVNAVRCCPLSLQALFVRFPYLTNVADKMLVDIERRKQALEESPEIHEDQLHYNSGRIVLDAHTFDQKLKYPNLLKVIDCLMSLPVSNAAVERLFSVLKLVKTDTRNLLKRKVWLVLSTLRKV
jgi:hypothetical protein